MEIIIYYLLIYFIEAIIWAEYVSNIFPPKHQKAFRYFSLFTIYIVLFLVLQFDIVWLNITFFLLGNLLFILLCYDSKWHTALFHAAIATALMSVCELIPYPFTLQYTNNTNYFSIMIIWAIFSKTLYSALLFLLSHSFHEKKAHNKNSDATILLLVCLPITTSIIMFILYVISTNYDINQKHGQLISIGAILLLFMNLLVFFIYTHNQKRNQIFTEMQLLLQKEHDLSEYYQALLKQNENQRILIHDIKNHLHSISHLNEQEEREKIATYIHQLTHSPALGNTARICDNKLLNLVLYQYQHQCTEKNILLQPDIRSGVIDFMEENDITSLFCNLLDNAVESAMKTMDGYIELSIDKRISTPFIIITLVNSCRVSPFSKDGTQLISHKGDPLRHGYGMKSIKRIVEKYHGDMQTYYDSENLTFHTIIMLRKQ